MSRLSVAAMVCALVGAGIGSCQFLEAVVPVGDTPGEIVWNPTYNKVYCVNEQDASVTVISGATNEVLTTIDVGDYPSFLCLSADGRKVYCSRSEEDRLVVIDASADTVLETITVRYRPGHMVYNATMNKLYISCSDDPAFCITVLDAVADTVLRRINVLGVGPLLWHPVTNRVFCYTAWNMDTVKVIDCTWDDIDVRLPMPTSQDLGYWCLSPRRDVAYLASRVGLFGFTPAGDSIIAKIPGWVGSVAAVPSGNKLYAVASGGIKVVDCWTQTVLKTLSGIDGWLLCDTLNGKVYAAARQMSVLDARADSLIKTIPLGRYPAGICWNRTDSRVYIGDGMDNVVYVIRDTTTGISEGDLPLWPRAASFDARPNPFRSSTMVHCRHGASHDAPLGIFAQTGALVRSLAGSGSWHWDGRDDHGRLVPAGVYVLRSSGEAGALMVVKSE